MSQIPEFESPEQFYFDTPLYGISSIGYNEAQRQFRTTQRIDGWCPHCGRERTFITRPISRDALPSNDEGSPHYTGAVYLSCTKDEAHTITVHIRLVSGMLQKIGQFPSFATISLDQSKTYSKLLGKEYSSEFHKAIGLAAHGVGIGSFVYMRRIFELLIQSRFDEFKDSEGWSEIDFQQLRMADRIQHLKTHLPEFLVRNPKIYSILSLGVHELDEGTCLAFFDVLKAAIIVILEEDKKKREDLERQRSLEKAIANFTADQ